MNREQELKDLFAKVYAQEVSADAASKLLEKGGSPGTVFLERYWAPSPAAEPSEPPAAGGDWLVFLDGGHAPSVELQAAVRSRLAPDARMVTINAEPAGKHATEPSLAELSDWLAAGGSGPLHLLYLWSWPRASQPVPVWNHARIVFQCLQLLARSAWSGAVDLAYVFACGTGLDDVPHLAVDGLCRTAGLELAGFRYKVIGVEAETVGAAGLAGEIIRADGESHVLFGGSGRLAARSREVQPESGADVAQEPAGCWLITGGLGGLGRLCASHLIGRGVGKLVLGGRSALGPDQRAFLDGLRAKGAEVEYLTVDLAVRKEVQAFVRKAKKRFGQISGVVHAAGLLADSLLARKDRADFDRVVAPKAAVLSLHEETRDQPIGHFVVFSSIAALTGNLGQSDYAYANSFLDAFAGMRNQAVASGKAQGRTVSVNWPHWDDLGMNQGVVDQDEVRGALGLEALDRQTGLAAFDAAMGGSWDQVAVLHGDIGRIRSVWLAEPASKAGVPAMPDSPIAVPDAMAVTALRAYLVQVLAAQTGVAAEQIDPDDSFDRYGTDSNDILNMTKKIEERFGPLSKATFFQYPTIRKLGDHFLSAFPEKVREFRVAAAALPNPAAVQAPVPAPSPATTAVNGPKEPTSGRDIAIIGLSGVYPEAATLAEFWDNLRLGRDCIREVPPGRWDLEEHYSPRKGDEGTMYARWGGFLERVEDFDALFFEISPRDAELMDPQERLFLESAWHTVEDAGYSKAALAEFRVGVYVGVMWGQYHLLGMDLWNEGQRVTPESSYASIANRVSWVLDLDGPSMAVDTMCSSSLTAIHLACQGLLSGETDMALAGGVNLSLHPYKYQQLCDGQFAASDGRCRSFGKGGDGYVPGEGVGSVLLKPLAMARRDGDHIYGVIKASALNAGGRTAGYTVPNPDAQARVIVRALDAAGVPAAGVQYVEAHGTGTALGDPIEIAGLGQAFGLPGSAGQLPALSCPIGSVKSNIGHLESAAGMAGLTKILLQMKHGQVVPSLHSAELNPFISFERTPFFVPQSLRDWPRPAGGRRTALLSGFGAGGANASLLVQEAGAEPSVAGEGPAAVSPEARIIVVSAKSPAALKAAVGSLLRELEQRPEDPAAFRDFAYTLLVGRTAFDERLAVIARDFRELAEAWRTFLDQGTAGDSLLAANARKSRAETTKFLLDDPDWLAAAIQAGNWKKIARLWSMGAELDGAALFAGQPCARLSLPGYPFQRERYWIGDRKVRRSAGSGAAESLLVGPVWEKKPLASPAQPRQDAACGLVLLPAGWDLPAATLGESRYAVQPGSGFERSGARGFAVDGASPAAWQALWTALSDEGQTVGEIVDLRCLVPGTGVAGPAEAAMILLQGFLSAHPGRALRFVHVHDEGGARAPACSALAAFGRSVQAEYPGLAWTSLALDSPRARSALSAWEAITAELPVSGDVEVRLRAGERWVRGLAPLRAAVDGQPALFRENGVYIVTGGLGELGLLSAAEALRSAGVRIALCGRSAPSPEKLARIEAWNQAGREVIYHAVDIAEPAAVQELFALVSGRWGRIDGVIHSAGVTRDSAFLQKSPAQLAEVLSAKVAGTENLYRALSDYPGSALVLYSSISSVFGNAGQADYAYANRFMDDFAEARAAETELPVRVFSMAFPYWQAGGIRLDEGVIRAMERATGLRPLPADAGFAALAAAWRSGVPSAAVLYGAAGRLTPLLRSGPETAAAPADREPSSLPAAAHDWRAFLRASFADSLHLAERQIADDVTFTEYGIDSLAVNRFSSQMEALVGPIPKTLLFEYRTIDELAEYFHAHHPAPSLMADAAAGSGAGPRVPDAVRPAPAQAAPTLADAVPAVLVTGWPVAGPEQDMAIIGLSGRYPAADSVEEFWSNLSAGKDCVGELPPGRWNMDDYFDPDPDKAGEGKIYCKWGGFLRGIDEFDPLFFSISPREALTMDPQERLFLQTAWEAFEDAGYARNKRSFITSRNHVGLFLGVTTTTHHLTGAEHWEHGNMVTPSTYPWSIANRVSYFMNWTGPSMAIDTACSSSLTAIHLAVESIRRGECGMAIAGGVNIYHHPYKYVSMCQGRMLSPTGRCHAFGVEANGFVPGEGVGAILIKPYEKALRDGDHIHGLIKASSVNHGGLTNGFTIPNPESQAAVIRDALRAARIAPETLTHIEAHGTGTALGDPIEVRGLAKALADERGHFKPGQECALSSSKSNIGHLEAAAGIAGVTKVLLEMRHGTLVPSLHTDELNGSIDFSGTPLKVQRRSAPWVPNGAPLRAGVSSFGAGGANSHVILEKAPDPCPLQVAAGPGVFVLSARNRDALRRYAAKLLSHLRGAEAPVSGRPDPEAVAAVVTEATRSILGLSGGELDLSESFAALGIETYEMHLLLERIRDSLGSEADCSGITQDHNVGDLVGIFRAAPSAPAGAGGADGFWQDLCYTLQTGREAMECRLAFVSPDARSAAGRLDAYLKGEEGACLTGTLEGPGVRTRIDAAYWQSNGAEAVAREWVAGAEVDWDACHGTVRPRRVPAPTYPFAGTVCRIEYPPAAKAAAMTAAPLKLQKPPMPAPSPAPVSSGTETSPRKDSMHNSPEAKPVRKIALKDTRSPDAPLAESVRPLPSAPSAPSAPPRPAAGQVSATAPAESPTGKVSPAAIRDSVRDSLAKVLYVAAADIPADKPFIELGLDSILLVEFVKIINKTYGLQLTATKLFDHPTVTQLSAHLAGLVAEETAAAAPAAAGSQSGPVPVPEPAPSAHHQAAAHPSVAAGPSLESIRQTVRENLAKVLYIKEGDIATEKPFIEMGLDSILLVELVKALNKIYGITLTATKLFDHPTVQLLSQYIHQQSPAGQSGPTPAGEADAEHRAPAQRMPGAAVEAVEAPAPSPVAGAARKLVLKRDAAPAERPASVERPAPEAPVTMAPAGPEPRKPQQRVGYERTNCLGLGLFGASEPQDAALAGVFVPEPAENEVQIRVMASGMNFPDLLCIRGLYPTMPDFPYVPGFEVAGTIVALGPGASQFQVGEEVFGLTGWKLGGHAELANLPVNSITRKPEGLAHTDAAALPIAFITAYYALHEAGKIKPGEHVLIQTAAGGVGMMAVHLAKLQGAVIFGTTGSAEKLQVLEGLGVDYPINYAQEDFHRVVMERTRGRGVDIVINTLSGDAIQKGLDCLAPGGRYVELAVAAFRAQPSLRLSRLIENQSIHSVDLRRIQGENSLAAYLDLAASLVLEGRIRPNVMRTVDAGDVREALQWIDSRRSTGKAVLDFSRLARAAGGPARPEAQSAPAGAMDIAVIGMAGQFPGAASVTEFWETLKAGSSAITEIPGDRWAIDGFYDADPQVPDRSYSKWGGFMRDIDKFDPLFFDLSPREAELMDPQQRLFLMETWRAIEDAGYAAPALSGQNCGVFVGVTGGDYTHNLNISGNSLLTQLYMGSSNPILSARIAYLLNLKGPNICVDTACSSSLVAVHLACTAIANGECDTALAGGVYAMTSPYFHIMASKAGMLSRTGQCHTFDAAADGFVPGEAVGVLYLKKLSRAVQDGDHIYGVVKGSGVNHDGRTNGITAPSAQAQGDLESAVYQRCRVAPESISYIETHGTGTRLGDPIEIDALKESHRGRRRKCAIGSVKSNVGHTLTASGVVSTIKTLLCLDRKTLVPSLNYRQENPALMLADSPFYVSTGVAEWATDGKAPRRAAVSSFGFGGTNAHLVLEEYQAPRALAKPAAGPVLLAFSAPTRTALRQKLEGFSAWLAQPEHQSSPLGQVGFTLLAGRQQFAHRLAFIADGHAELRAVLGGLLRGEVEDSPFHGLAESGDAARDGLRQDTVARLAALNPRGARPGREELGVFAEAFRRGADLDWAPLFDTADRRRLSLPTYPFARKRYWKPESPAVAAPVAGTMVQPFWDSHEDTATGRIYRKRFTGQEFYLADHVNTVPGVVYVEWARAVAEHWKGEIAEIRQLVISVPLTLSSGAQDVAMELKALPDGQIEWVARSFQGTNVNHAQGRCLPGRRLPLGESRPESGNPQPRTALAAADFYRQLEANGSRLGARFQGLRALSLAGSSLVASVQLPEGLGAEAGAFHLHPTLTDSGMQAAVALAYALGADPHALHLPYIIEECRLHAGTGQTVRIRATSRAASYAGSTQPMIFDLEYLDAADRILTRLRGLYLKTYKPPRHEDGGAAGGAHFYRPVWREKAIPALTADTSAKDQAVVLGSDSKQGRALVRQLEKNRVPGHFVALGDELNRTPGKLQAGRNLETDLPLILADLRIASAGNPTLVLALDDPHQSPAGALPEFDPAPVERLFALAKGLGAVGAASARIVVLCPHRAGLSAPAHQALAGFLRTLALEKPQFGCKLIQHDLPQEDGTALAELLAREMSAWEDRDLEVRWTARSRQVRGLESWRPQPAAGAPLPRRDGTYLVTGGLGGLGQLVAEDLARNCAPTILLLGRRAPGQAEAALGRLRQLGARAEYLQADIARSHELEQCTAEAMRRYGPVTGVFHCAGVNADNLIQNRCFDSYAPVFGPKIQGLLNLAGALKDCRLDFWVNFSSLAAQTGNAGQSCYSYANRYLHAFAALHQDAAGRQRFGRFISIAWPLWRNGGMGVSAQVETYLRQTGGIHPLGDREGLLALQALLQAGEPDALVVAGEPARFEPFLGITGPEVPPVRSAGQPNQSSPAPSAGPAFPASSALPGADGIKSRLVGEVRAVVARVSKFDTGEIESGLLLSKYGFDSITYTELSNALNAQLGINCTPALFYEQTTIDSLCAVLLRDYGPTLQQRFAAPEVAVSGPFAEPASAPVNEGQPGGQPAGLPGAFIPASIPAGPEAIAIIGMDAVMPQSADLEEFWNHLAAGHDLITPVPLSRWDWKEYRSSLVKDPDNARVHRGGFLASIADFDPGFFGISPLEAEIMDPQQRLMLEVSWKTLEDAGCPPSRISGRKVGVYIGVCNTDYKELLGEELSKRVLMVNSMIANRISYFYNFNGPSEPIDTACSSSLVALHRAVESLRHGEIELALVGGVNVIANPATFIACVNAGMLSPDGQCRTFDKGANGYVRGEGAGAVLLKPLSKALCDGDRVHAVIRNTAVNHGGHATSPTAPNFSAQAEVMVQAYRGLGWTLDDIDYLEAHGTGTALGDPVEIEGLKKARAILAEGGGSAPGASGCGLGSVKTNIGHLESAAGMAGLFKVVLAMKHGAIPPSLHLKELNPHIRLENTPFRIVTSLQPWNSQERGGQVLPRRGAVSSFGIGGVNAHVILEEYRTELPATTTTGPQVFVLSARTREQLTRRVAQLREWLGGGQAPADSAVSLRGLVAGLLGIEAAALGQDSPLLELGAEPIHLEKLAGSLEQHWSLRLSCDELAALSLQSIERRLPAPAAPAVSAGDLAHTLQSGREAFKLRCAVVADSLGGLAAQLDEILKGNWSGPGRHLGGEGRSSGSDHPDRAAAEPGADCDSLAAAWVAGQAIDWPRHFRGPAPRLVSLPGYPFTRKPYWLPQAAKAAPVPALRPLVLSWEESRPSLQPLADLSGQEWLLLTATAQASGASALAARFESAGCRIRALEWDGLVGDASLAGGQAAWRQLWAEAGNPTCAGLIDLCALADSPAQEPDWKKVGFLQGLAEQRRAGAFRLFFGHAGSLAGSQAPALAGLVRVLGAEYRKIDARVLWLDPGFDPALLSEALAMEMRITDSQPDIRYRGSQRCAAVLEAVPEQRLAEVPAYRRLAGTDVVLVTGGTGGIGFEIIRHLAKSGLRRFALTAHQPIAAQSAWQALADTRRDDSETTRVRRLLELDKLKLELRIHTGSLAGPEFVAFLESVRREWGPVRGVVHCAGAASFKDPAFVHKQEAEIRQVFEPKVQALPALARALEGHRPEFFLALSSIGGLAPRLGVGNADYAAANHFMDIYAAERAGGPGLFLSFASPLWHSGGMRGAETALAQSLGLHGLSTAEGLAAIDRVLSLRQGGCVTCGGMGPDFDARALLRSRDAVAADARIVSAGLAAPGRPDHAAAPAQLAGLLRTLIAEEFKLEPAEIQDDVPFSDLGIDSILMGQLLTRIEAALDHKVEPSAFMEHPTIGQLAAHLAPFAKPGEAQPEPQPAMEPQPAPEIGGGTTAAAAARVPLRTGDRRVAVIGMACNFPGAPDLDSYWRNLVDGVSSISEVPPLRWDARALYSSAPAKGKSISKWGGFIEGIEYFDPSYFKLSEELGRHTDPLIRQFLEISVNCIRDAGYSAKELWGKKVGVFAGSRMTSTYAYRFEDTIRGTVLGVGQNFIAAHLSHFFNFKGPNLVIDTACSSSLVSIDLACKSLLHGESDLALAGGVDILLDEKPFVHLSADQVLSPQGTCHAFDERANGLVPGEGCGIVLLKTLEKALADGDDIYAVIEAGAVNNDGHTMGITTPNPEAQAEVITAALNAGGIDPGTITMVEAHGTGTQIGDPIELKALTKVFRQSTKAEQFCAVGSVKTNIGHLFSAAGVASFIKVVLALKHRIMPATLNCERPNPRFEFKTSPFYPNVATRPWEPRGAVRRAGISAFGFGGTNAHLIVAELPESPGSPVRRTRLAPEQFNRKRLWLEDKSAQAAAGAAAGPAAAPAAQTPAQPTPQAPAPEAARTAAREKTGYQLVLESVKK